MMTEKPQASGIEYSEVFIGDCCGGSCTRPATVRVHEDFVLCALHHLLYEIGQEKDEAALALELIAGWRSIAAMHRNGYLLELFEYAHDELIERRAVAQTRMAQIDRADLESGPGEDIRAKMGEAEIVGKIQYPTVFAKVLSKQAGYLGEDMAQLAHDLVSAIGTPYGDAERDALQARLESDATSGPSGAFMHELTRYLDLDRDGQMELAMALAFEN